MKSLFKRLFKTEFFRRLLCWLAASYVRFVYYTSRVSIDAPEEAQPYVSGNLPAVFAFWHGRLLMMAMLNPKKRKMNVVISIHRDGEMLARTLRHFGVGTIRGSTSRGGTSAAINSVKLLKTGDNLSITPDGPRGPAMVAQGGIVSIARLAGLPIVPASYSSTHHRRMKTWDRFIVALPFGRIYYKVGEPMMNPTTQELEEELIRGCSSNKTRKAVCIEHTYFIF